MKAGGVGQQLDFDEEGRRLQSSNLPQLGGKWNHLDPIFNHPTGRGTIYVGNQTAAQDLTILKKLNITRVVNCTHNIPNFHQAGGEIKYIEFNISYWQMQTNSSDSSIIKFSKPLFDFIDSSIENGESVLVHCLAGAHRAGTTGCACLVHYTGLDVATAIKTAKRLRPIIDPIGHLPDFLHRLYKAESLSKSKTDAPSDGSGATSPSATALFLQQARQALNNSSSGGDSSSNAGAGGGEVER